MRKARGPNGVSSCTASTTPRFLREAYSIRPVAGDATIASYCADPLSEVDPRLGFSS